MSDPRGPGDRHPLLTLVASGRVLVADGAMGSLLMGRGLEGGACPESWNLSRPEVLREVAGQYLRAGAQILQTNTFGGHPLKLERYGLAEATEEINRAAVQAVSEAVSEAAGEAVREAVSEAAQAIRVEPDTVGPEVSAPEPVFISGSVGPCGRTLQPYGDAHPEEVAAGFRRQIAALVAAGVDVLCVETMTDLEEARLAVAAAKALSPGTPVMATMTFEATSRGFFTIMGNSLPAVVEGLQEAGADLVGSNCGNGSDQMVAIARQLKQHAARPLIIQANAGLPQLRGGAVVYPETPSFMAEKAREMAAIGVGIIGGCCGTTPAHIAAIRHAVNPPG